MKTIARTHGRSRNAKLKSYCNQKGRRVIHSVRSKQDETFRRHWTSISSGGHVSPTAERAIAPLKSLSASTRIAADRFQVSIVMDLDLSAGHEQRTRQGFGSTTDPKDN